MLHCWYFLTSHILETHVTFDDIAVRERHVLTASSIGQQCDMENIYHSHQTSLTLTNQASLSPTKPHSHKPSLTLTNQASISLTLASVCAFSSLEP